MAVETRIMNCIMCPLGCEMTVTIEDGAVTSVTGNTCPRGPKYAHDEVVAPKRMLTSTVQVKGGLLPLLPVVSKTTLPKERILDCAVRIRFCCRRQSRIFIFSVAGFVNSVKGKLL